MDAGAGDRTSAGTGVTVAEVTEATGTEKAELTDFLFFKEERRSREEFFSAALLLPKKKKSVV